MFFILSKLLSFLISPLVWVFFLLCYSFITKIDQRAKKLRIISLIIIYLCSNSFLVDECFRAWEPNTEDYETNGKTYEGAIVLGGIGDIDLRMQKINFGHSGDRLFQTLPLFYSGKINKLIFTGGSGSIEFPEKKEGIYVKKYLQSIHFPDSALIVESTSKNTYENALFTKHLLDSLNIKGEFLLVTSGYHMPRSIAVFKKAGFESVFPFVTNRNSGLRRYTFDHLFIPNPSALIAFHLLLHEWVGYATYKLKGYA